MADIYSTKSGIVVRGTANESYFIYLKRRPDDTDLQFVKDVYALGKRDKQKEIKNVLLSED